MGARRIAGEQLLGVLGVPVVGLGLGRRFDRDRRGVQDHARQRDTGGAEVAPVPIEVSELVGFELVLSLLGVGAALHVAARFCEAGHALDFVSADHGDRDPGRRHRRPEHERGVTHGALELVHDLSPLAEPGNAGRRQLERAGLLHAAERSGQGVEWSALVQ